MAVLQCEKKIVMHQRYNPYRYFPLWEMPQESWQNPGWKKPSDLESWLEIELRLADEFPNYMTLFTFTTTLYDR